MAIIMITEKEMKVDLNTMLLNNHCLFIYFRIHEYIVTEEKETLNSLLLDLDHRYVSTFCHV